MVFGSPDIRRAFLRLMPMLLKRFPTRAFKGQPMAISPWVLVPPDLSKRVGDVGAQPIWVISAPFTGGTLGISELSWIFHGGTQNQWDAYIIV